MKWLIWALFGNDEDGKYGFYPHNTWGAVRWWLRNPFHNLLWHVWRKEGGWFWSINRRPPDWRHPPGAHWDIYVGHRPFSNPKGAWGAAFRYRK